MLLFTTLSWILYDWVKFCQCLGLPSQLSAYPLCARNDGGQGRFSQYKPAIDSSEELGGKCRLEDFKKHKLLGTGHIGKVYLAQHLPSGKKVALKEVIALDPEKRGRLRAEECYHHALSHPNIAKHYCTMSDASMVYMAIEWVPGRELRPLLREGHRKLSSSLKMGLIGQIMDAITYMHGQGIIYGDLKTANVILQDDGHIKLIDFGLARLESGKRGFKETFQVDWFLLGAFIFELATDGKIFRDYCVDAGKWRKPQRRIKCPKALSDTICELIKDLTIKGSRYDISNLQQRISQIQL